MIFKSNGIKYKYTLKFTDANAEAYVDTESLEMATKEVCWHNLFDTDDVRPGDFLDQIIARFDKNRPGPRKGINLRRDIAVLSQVQGQKIFKIIEDGTKAALDSFASICVNGLLWLGE